MAGVLFFVQVKKEGEPSEIAVKDTDTVGEIGLLKAELDRTGFTVTGVRYPQTARIDAPSIARELGFRTRAQYLRS